MNQLALPTQWADDFVRSLSPPPLTLGEIKALAIALKLAPTGDLYCYRSTWASPYRFSIGYMRKLIAKLIHRDLLERVPHQIGRGHHGRWRINFTAIARLGSDVKRSILGALRALGANVLRRLGEAARCVLLPPRKTPKMTPFRGRTPISRHTKIKQHQNPSDLDEPKAKLLLSAAPAMKPELATRLAQSASMQAVQYVVERVNKLGTTVKNRVGFIRSAICNNWFGQDSKDSAAKAEARSRALERQAAARQRVLDPMDCLSAEERRRVFHEMRQGFSRPKAPPTIASDEAIRAAEAIRRFTT